MREQLELLPYLLGAHVRLTLAALLVGAALAVPVGILVSRAPRLEGLVLGLAGVVQTVPALALLAVMVPLLSSLGLSGIGFLPAFLGLVLYSLLPILRNTVTGLAGIDPAVREAAEGVGMTPWQRLRMVELPLALPVILAGLRTATVWSVGMATLSTPVGAPSLGNYIFSGLQTRNYDAVLVGCAAAALLALGLDALLRVLARGYSERRPALVLAGGAILVALGALSVAGLAPARAERPLRIGAKTFTEQYVLAEVLARQIHRKTGAPAEVLASLGSTVAFDALARGEIDAYVEYTGTIRSTLMHRTGAGAGRAAVLAEVRRWLQRDTRRERRLLPRASRTPTRSRCAAPRPMSSAVHAPAAPGGGQAPPRRSRGCAPDTSGAQAAQAHASLRRPGAARHILRRVLLGQRATRVRLGNGGFRDRLAAGHVPRVPRFRLGRVLCRRASLDAGRLALAPANAPRHAPRFKRRGRRLACDLALRRGALRRRRRVAGEREPLRGTGLRALERRPTAERARVSPGGLRHARRRNAATIPGATRHRLRSAQTWASAAGARRPRARIPWARAPSAFTSSSATDGSGPRQLSGPSLASGP